jgi:hypothetical protein
MSEDIKLRLLCNVTDRSPLNKLLCGINLHMCYPPLGIGTATTVEESEDFKLPTISDCSCRPCRCSLGNIGAKGPKTLNYHARGECVESEDGKLLVESATRIMAIDFHRLP